MSTEYEIITDSSNGEAISSRIGATFASFYVTVGFYSDANLQTPVTPTGGTVDILVSDDDGENFSNVVNGHVVAKIANNIRPNWYAPTFLVKAVKNNLTGANFVKIKIYAR